MAAAARTRPPRETMFALAPLPGVLVEEGEALLPAPVEAPEAGPERVAEETVPLEEGTMEPIAPDAEVTTVVGTTTTPVVITAELPGTSVRVTEGATPDGMATPDEAGAADVAGGAWIWPSLIWVMGRTVVWAKATAAKTARVIA